MTLTKQQELELFAQLAANNPRIKDWVEQKNKEGRAVLTKNRDPVTLHQYQGRAQLLDEMEAMLVNANNVLRGI